MVVIGFATALLAVAYGLAFLPGVGPTVPAGLLAVGTALALAGTLALGAERGGRLGVLWIPVVFVVVIVAGGMLTLLALPATDSADPTLVLGLPPRAALLLYGIGLVPTLVVPVAYALTFDRLTLSAEDLARVRAAAERRTAGTDDAAPSGGIE
jgi:hypothetical protein